MDHIYISVSDIPQSWASQSQESWACLSLGNPPVLEIPSVPQSWPSLSLAHLSLGHPSGVLGIPSIPQSRTSQSRASLWSLGNPKHPSVSGISILRHLILGHLSLGHSSVSGISSSQASLHLRHLLASDTSEPWGSIWIIYLSLRHLSASGVAQPRTMLSLGQCSASGIAQPQATLSLRHRSASGNAQPRASLSLTVFDCSFNRHFLVMQIHGHASFCMWILQHYWMRQF